MIRPLRRTHRWAIPALTVLVVTLFIASLLLRPAPPANNPQFKPASATGGAR
ncbi:MAG TPA: hypothetical protein PLD20_27450 [Blastocatellia bacterium]|nr:hypothetical protein [Blastocatellia bacterium]HMV84210.1 hypothetical protein [Blastocatellia bacterium]HMX26677.1 hypothetical protein [Blastocatellia bacterium]HMY73253.1 hypothetical protein [Blastocatellia bacterium]HMZ21698.1 hypothetical protein [Blastocatellia bacterium]